MTQLGDVIEATKKNFIQATALAERFASSHYMLDAVELFDNFIELRDREALRAGHRRAVEIERDVMADLGSKCDADTPVVAVRERGTAEWKNLSAREFASVLVEGPDRSLKAVEVAIWRVILDVRWELISWVFPASFDAVIRNVSELVDETKELTLFDTARAFESASRES